MVTLTSVEIIEYRAELASDAEALKALDMIEDCEGDVEDAAIALAIQAGQEPDRSEHWLEGFAKRWRVFICQPEFRAKLAEESIANAVRSLTTETNVPASLAFPITVYVLKTGLDDFCQVIGDLG